MKVVGYTDPMSAAPGDNVRFMVSCTEPTYRADIVKLRSCGENSDDPRFKFTQVSTSVSGEYPGRDQAIEIGSYVSVPDAAPLRLTGAFPIAAWIYPTTPDAGAQGIVTKWSDGDGDGYGLFIDEAAGLSLWVGDGRGSVEKLSTGEPLQAGEWYFVAGSFDPAERRLSVYQRPLSRWRASERLWAVRDSGQFPGIAGGGLPLLIAAYWRIDSSGSPTAAGLFNGKIDGPRIFDRALAEAEVEALSGDEPPAGLEDEAIAAWDFSREISSQTVIDASSNRRHGLAINMPMRGVTGHNWSGRETDFKRAPQEYGAIYFHDDDLDDAGWDADFELDIPSDLKSGIYAARLRVDEFEDYVPFFVRAPRGSATAPVLFLAPTFTYIAYANEHFYDRPRAVAPNVNREIYADQYDYVKSNRLGSLYDHHPDGTGHAYSSRLVPTVTLRPMYYNRGCNAPFLFSADLHLTDWLEERGYDYDVATDEDLHAEGADLLSRYSVVLTGTHPEYYTESMLDGLEGYLGNGGRLMYLGGNGFYWVTSIDPERPHVIEIRRRQGTRMWEAALGEFHHSTTGESGGLWRYRGRAPQRLVGIGFAGQGVDAGTPYHRRPDSFEPRAAFIFEGIDDEEPIGDHPSEVLDTGAAGLELDRYDFALGTPPHALILASSSGHSSVYQRTVEEVHLMDGRQGAPDDADVRADLLFFETDRGGAVFSVGSITWCASLSYNTYENNVSRITGNVLNRFLSDEAF